MNITYRVKRSRKRRKTISLQVRNESEIHISAPFYTPIDEINHFIEEKQNWIHKTIQKQKRDAAESRAKRYETGEYMLYLGKTYSLKVFFEPFENPGVVFYKDLFYLNARDDIDLKRHYFIAWYKKKAYDFLSQRVDYFSRRLKLPYQHFRITSAEHRWGSCSEDNNLAFSFRLIMTPPEVIDYVIVHELMHIKEKNHSSKFWRRVEDVIPEYKEHRRWLKDNSHKFIL